MLEFCKEASNDCIWDDSDSSDTCFGVLHRVFNLDLFLDLFNFDMLTCIPIVWKTALKDFQSASTFH